MSTVRYVARLFRRLSSFDVTSVFFATHCNLQLFFGKKKKWLQASSWLQVKFCPKQHLSAKCPRPRVVAKAVLKHTKRTWDWKVGQWRRTPWRKLVHRVKRGLNSRGKCEQGRWKPGWYSNREYLLGNHLPLVLCRGFVNHSCVQERPCPDIHNPGFLCS